MVVGFLKFARPDELKLQPMSLVELVSDVATTVTPEAERLNVTMKVECQPDAAARSMRIPGCCGRRCSISRSMRARRCPTAARCASPATRRHASASRSTCEDTGIGIPPENLSKIFDLYFTTKEKGSGIGLSMVYRIVQLHDGEVEVQSTPGHGTTFKLVFPQA